MATKLLPGQTHLDHGLTRAQLGYVLASCGGKLYEEAKKNNNAVTLDLPPELGTVWCGLYGPAMDDLPVGEEEVHYDHRGDREWKSRLVDRPRRSIDYVTAIILPEWQVKQEDPPGPDSLLVVDWYLLTAYGGPPAPREPGDPSLPPDSPELADAIDFWRYHALAADV